MNSYLKGDKARRPLRIIYYTLLLLASSGGFFAIVGSLAAVATWMLILVFVLLGIGAALSLIGVVSDHWRFELIGLPLLLGAFTDLTLIVGASLLTHPTAGLVVATLFYGALIFNALIRYSEVREIRRIARHYTETRK